MTKAYTDILEEAFQDPFNFSGDKMETVISETVEYLKDVKERFESGDPEVREKAREMALAMQEGLLKQVEELCKKTGLSMDQLTALAPGHVNEDQKKQLQEADKKFEAIFNKQEKEEKEEKVKTFKKSKKINIAG